MCSLAGTGKYKLAIMSRVKRSYEAKFKLQVTAFAEHKSNRAEGHEFSVSEKIVRDWRKQKSKLEKMPNVY